MRTRKVELRDAVAQRRHLGPRGAYPPQPMTTGTKRRPYRRDEILAAAVKLFHERGYHAHRHGRHRRRSRHQRSGDLPPLQGQGRDPRGPAARRRADWPRRRRTKSCAAAPSPRQALERLVAPLRRHHRGEPGARVRRHVRAPHVERRDASEDGPARAIAPRGVAPRASADAAASCTTREARIMIRAVHGMAVAAIVYRSGMERQRARRPRHRHDDEGAAGQAPVAGVTRTRAGASRRTRRCLRARRDARPSGRSRRPRPRGAVRAIRRGSCAAVASPRPARVPGPGGERASDRLDLGVERVVGDDARDETDLERARRRRAGVLMSVSSCARAQPDEAREQERGAAVGVEPDLRVGDDEPGAARRRSRCRRRPRGRGRRPPRCPARRRRSGASMRASATIAAWRCDVTSRRCAGRSSRAANALRSPPTQKLRPAPRITTTCTVGSASAASAASWRSRASSRFTALPASGRSSVIVPIPSPP